MPAKHLSKKKPDKKSPGKKPGFSRLVMIVFAILIALAFIFFSIYTPKTKKMPSDRTKSSVNKPPEFKKEGTVRIISGENAVNLDVEVAQDDDERTQGLMYRYTMEENQGMFFIFPQEDWRSFWMKNTFISLDIIYINSKFEIVSIQKYTQPKSTYSLPSELPAKYVLEVNAGFADKHGIGPGDKVEFLSPES